MDFKAAVDRLRDCDTRETIAEELGVSVHSVIQGMLPDDSPGKRPSPVDWERGIANLARKRAAALVKLANQLDPELRKARAER